MSAVLETELQFRPMVEQDLDTILLIEQQAYGFPWSRKIFLDCIRVGYQCYLLHDHQAVIGYSVSSIAAGECHVLNLCINPDHQQQGYGKIMLDFILDNAIRQQVQTIFLEVRPSNHAALKLYDGFGFTEVGQRKEYYPGKKQREDAVIMAKQLILDTIDN